MASRVGKKIETFIEKRTATNEQRHQLIVFLIGILSGIVGFPLHILGVWGSPNTVLQLLSVAIWTGLTAILFLYMYKKVSLHTAFSWYGIIMQSFLSAKIVFIAITRPAGGNYLILFNSFISLLVITLLVMGYIRVMPIILTIASFLTTVAARIIAPDAVQMQFLLFFLFVELISCAIGLSAWQGMHDVERENAEYREEESGILSTLHMTRAELLAYIAMSRNGNPTPQEVNRIFDRLDEKSEHNIMKALRLRETELRMQTVEVKNAFPTLTATEQEVCRLVMRGKTLNEIANLLGKNANNISAVRIHIRKKLGLETGQDLRGYLLAQVKRNE